MSISGSEILKIVAFPFRIYNVKQLNIDMFVFTLSFQAFENCNITTAKKILHLAIEQEKVKRTNNSIIVKFDPWALEIPINWKPNFKVLEKVPEAKLEPPPDTVPLEIKPISFEINGEESLTEPFQLDGDLLKAMKAEKTEKKKETDVQKGEIIPKKIEKEKKKAKEKIKQKKLIKTTEKVKKIKKTKKTKKKTKTLLDFMNK